MYVLDSSDWPTIAIATEVADLIPFEAYPTVRADPDSEAVHISYRDKWSRTGVAIPATEGHIQISNPSDIREVLDKAREWVRGLNASVNPA